MDEQWAELRADVVRARDVRRDGLVGRDELVASLEALLFRHDPIGLDFGDNIDEYRAEAETICLRWVEAASEADLQRIMHEEFVVWFGADTAGPADRYAAAAEEAWRTFGDRLDAGTAD
jgi:hypothetical protein